jgi:hypothetical protein
VKKDGRLVGAIIAVNTDCDEFRNTNRMGSTLPKKPKPQRQSA